MPGPMLIASHPRQTFGARRPEDFPVGSWDLRMVRNDGRLYDHKHVYNWRVAICMRMEGGVGEFFRYYRDFFVQTSLSYNNSPLVRGMQIDPRNVLIDVG